MRECLTKNMMHDSLTHPLVFQLANCPRISFTDDELLGSAVQFVNYQSLKPAVYLQKNVDSVRGR
jgi:hypothetical protein